MTLEEFRKEIQRSEQIIASIRQAAYDIHEGVNQRYGSVHPYGYHLDMVADCVKENLPMGCDEPNEIVPVFFGAYFHDSIEDARMTYSDVMKAAKKFLDSSGALIATEIAYALTNEKGRNREERAGEKYFALIRETPYAPLVKACDRLANIVFSCNEPTELNERMKAVYRRELDHFLTNIKSEKAEFDHRLSVPSALIAKMIKLLEG